MLPAVLLGGPYEVPPLLLARDFAETGLFTLTDAIGRFSTPAFLVRDGVMSAADGRLTTMMLAAIAQLVSWQNLLGWSMVSGASLAVGLVFWWIAVRAYFPRSIAWVSTAVLAFMPFYAVQAITLTYYSFAYPFLFASIAAFGWITPKRPFLRYALSGVLFGCAIACKDAFIVFLPWYVLAFLFFNRKKFKKVWAHGIVFLCATFLLYLAPYANDLRTLGFPVNHNLALLWGAEGNISNDIYLHLYPDPYTYFFDKQRFDTAYVAHVQTLPLLERLQQEKLLKNFNLGTPTVGGSLLNGAFLFVVNLPAYLQIDSIGGIFMWALVLLGTVVLWKKEKRFVIAIGGLILLSELIVRFVLHFERDHSMDVLWLLSLPAAVGLSVIAESLSTKLKAWSAASILTILVIALSIQHLQQERIVLARLYTHSQKEESLALVAAAKKLPATAVIAMPLHTDIIQAVALLSSRTTVPFSEETIARLQKEGTLDQALQKYGVTNALGYDAASQAILIQHRIVTPPFVEPTPPEVSSGMRFILSIIR